jgi:beta-lactamase regulating signal transducer with metallopeptidase domain
MTMPVVAMNLPLEISRFIAQAFIAGLWQGLALVSAVAIVLRFIPRVNAAVRFVIWGFAFALAVAIPLLHLPTPAVLQPHAASAVVHLGTRWGFAIAAIWVTFMLVRGAQLLMHTIRLHRTWKQATPVPIEETIHALLQRSGRRTVQLCTSKDVDSPSVIGFFSPRLLIPEWLFSKLAPSELRQIVLHECEHLRRGDDWINLLQKVGLVLFPLNPALLWLDRRLGLERELACDAGVVSSTAAPFDYAHCLTRLAEYRLHRRSVALSLSAWSRQSELTRRVHSLLRPTRNMSPLLVRLSITLICLGLGVSAVEMARFPHLVSFADPVTTAPVAEIAIPAPDPATMHELPVVYRSDAQPHPTMQNAVLTLHKAHRTPHRPSRGVQPLRSNAPTASPSRQPRVVLTALEIQHRQASFVAGPVYTQPTQFAPSYAAIPFGDGWLVIQL